MNKKLSQLLSIFLVGAMVIGGCSAGLDNNASGQISSSIVAPSTTASCLQLESDSGNQYCQIQLTVQNNQSNKALTIAYTTDPSNVNIGLPAGYSVGSLSSCQSAMNNNVGTQQKCSTYIQYNGGNYNASANVYFMLCSGNCSTNGNPVVITGSPIQINSAN